MSFKDKDDFYSHWCNFESEVYIECWNEFLDKRGTGKPQHWTVMNSSEFVRLVRKGYAGTLDDDDRQLIDRYTELIFHNFLQLWFNTVTVGHSEQDPVESFLRYDVLGDPEEWDQAEMKALSEECCDWISHDAFSDYGIEPLRRLMEPMMLQQNYSLKVQVMTEIINITHMRGDLSVFFVENGRKTAFQIDVYEPELESIGD